MEVRACMRYLVANPQPSYLRLGKSGEPCQHAGVPQVAPGQWLPVRAGRGSGSTFLSTGAALELVTRLVDRTEAPCLHAVHSMPLWGMGSKAMQAQQVRGFAQVRTVEDHLVDGGFGSWLLEASMADPALLVRIRVKALDPRVCGMVGQQAVLNQTGGLTEAHLCA